MTKKELIEKIKCGEGVGSDLRGSDLRDSHLSCSNLSCSDLRDSDLRYAKYSIPIFLHSINWGILPDRLTLELMRHDALLVGTKAMTAWAKGGDCPFQKTVRGFYFQEKTELWKPGKPKMNEMELWIALCEEKKIKI